MTRTVFIVDSTVRIGDPIVVSPQMLAAHAGVLQQSVLVLHQTSHEQSILTRMLLGTVDIVSSSPKTSFRQSQNLAIYTWRRCRITTLPSLIAHLQANDIDVDRMNTHLRNTLRQRDYFRQLLIEATHFFAQQNVDRNVRAFVHLYRLLERIAYAFPMIYASRTKDFIATFSALKEFLQGSDTGELKFLDRFCRVTLDASLNDSDSTFSFSHLPLADAARAFRAIRRLVREQDVTSEVADQEITIRNSALLNLMISVRNRFFHFAVGRSDNLSMEELPPLEDFFACLNTPMMNWIAMIYFSILRTQLD